MSGAICYTVEYLAVVVVDRVVPESDVEMPIVILFEQPVQACDLS